VHRQQVGEAPRASIDSDDPNILDRWNSHTPEVSGGGILQSDRLRKEGTYERVTQTAWERAEMNETLQDPDQIPEHQSQYDGSALRRFDTRSAEGTIVPHRMEDGDASTGEIYATDSRMEISEVAHHPTISDLNSPKTGTQPIQARVIPINHQCPPSDVTMETRAEAARNASTEPEPAAVASPEASDEPLQVSVVISNSARLTGSISTETTEPSSTFEPVIPPSLPVSLSPLRMEEAVRGDTKRPLDVLVVDDDKSVLGKLPTCPFQHHGDPANPRLTRTLMAKMIKRLGHRVATAENGKIALDLITAAQKQADGARRVEVVFLDK
jgi:hypothetical protein